MVFLCKTSLHLKKSLILTKKISYMFERKTNLDNIYINTMISVLVQITLLTIVYSKINNDKILMILLFGE